MVLFVFVIMLLNAGAEHESQPLEIRASGRYPAVRGVRRADQLHRPEPVCRDSKPVYIRNLHRRRRREIGRALFTEYLLPFEVTSVLILIAIIGAIVLARKEI